MFGYEDHWGKRSLRIQEHKMLYAFESLAKVFACQCTSHGAKAQSYFLSYIASKNTACNVMQRVLNEHFLFFATIAAATHLLQYVYRSITTTSSIFTKTTEKLPFCEFFFDEQRRTTVNTLSRF